MLLRLVAQIDKINIAMLVATDYNHVHASHNGGGGVGSVRRRWNQRGNAVVVATAAVVGTNDQKARVLTLSA